MLFSDREKAALQKIVEDIASRYDYAGLWGATVVSQNADGTLELKPDAASLPGLSKVPILVGVPGITVTAQQGARCAVAFQNLDPEKPIAVAWEAHDLVSLAFANGAAPFARLGDPVSLAAIVGIFVGTIGGPPVTLPAILSAGAFGTIQTGSDTIEA